MHDPNESKPWNSAGPPSTESAGSGFAAPDAASVETHAPTFVQKTQSEAGNESAQLSASQKLSPSIGEGSTFGPYQIVRKLGQGAMGAVYEARHTKLKKTVAVKVLPPEMMKSPALIARFEREMEAVGALDHPHIVRAMDAGEFQGLHYLVMEYVEGTDLSVLVKERGVLSVRDACKVIRQASLGLQHAHEHGLVHRDIKPSNVFVTKSGQVKLLDLGLARLGSGDEANAGLTSSGQMLGTPDYMAPEQWDDTHSVDARADLYSLGCTLGFLLTGKAPFASDKPRTFLHIMKAHADAPPPDLTALRKSVPPELNALFQRLLAKKPEDRFQSAAEVVTALEPFVQRSRHAPRDEPNALGAGLPTPPSSTTVGLPSASSLEAPTDVVEGDLRTSSSAGSEDPRTARGQSDPPSTVPSFGDRNASHGMTRLRTRGLIAVIAVVVLAGIVITIQQKNARREAVDDRKTDNPVRQNESNAKNGTNEKTDRIVRPTTGDSAWRGTAVMVERGQPLSTQALVPRPEAIDGLRSWSIELATVSNFDRHTIATRPQGDLIATGGSFGKICLWNADGQLQHVLLGHDSCIFSLDFSPDGEWLASSEGAGSSSTTARLWHVASGTQVAVIPVPWWGWRVQFLPDGQRFTISTNGLLTYDRRTGQSQPWPQTDVVPVLWSPDGKRYVAQGQDRLKVCDSETNEVLCETEVLKGLKREFPCLAWSPDGTWLATWSLGRENIDIRHADTLAIARTGAAKPHGAGTITVVWLPDSRRIVVGQETGASGVFDTVSGERLATFEGTSNIIAVALLKNGDEAVLTDVNTKALKVFDTRTGKKLRDGGQYLHNGFSTLSSNGREVFSYVMQGQEIHVHDSETGTLQRKANVPETDANTGIYPAPNGAAIALMNWTVRPDVSIVDAQTGARLQTLSHGDAAVAQIAWSPDSQRLATAAKDKRVRVWNVTSGQIEHELIGHTDVVASLAWSPDGSRLATTGADKTLRLWNPRTGQPLATFNQFPEEMTLYEKKNSLASEDDDRLWIALNAHITSLNVRIGEFSPLENFSNGNLVTSLFPSPDRQRLLVREGYDFLFLRGRDPQDRHLLGQHLGGRTVPIGWHPDSRRYLACNFFSHETLAYDTERRQRLGRLWPMIQTTRPHQPTEPPQQHWLCLGPTGHYRGGNHSLALRAGGDNKHDAPASGPAGNDTPASAPASLDDLIVYVALHEDGSQHTYTPAQFRDKFGWKNNPEKATLLKLDAEK